LPINWPFSKRHQVRCPDGSTKIIYKNIDQAFPLYIPGWKGDLKADIKALEQASANVGAAYESKIQGLLFSLDERNQSLMINFRTVYITFVSDPCNRSAFLERQIEKIIDEQNHLSRLKMQIYSLIELAKNHPKKSNEIFALFQQIVSQLGGQSVSVGAVIEITESVSLTKEWIRSSRDES
jgi:hypothetical protein